MTANTQSMPIRLKARNVDLNTEGFPRFTELKILGTILLMEFLWIPNSLRTNVDAACHCCNCYRYRFFTVLPERRCYFSSRFCSNICVFRQSISSAYSELFYSQALFHSWSSKLLNTLALIDCRHSCFFSEAEKSSPEIVDIVPQVFDLSADISFQRASCDRWTDDDCGANTSRNFEKLFIMCLHSNNIHSEIFDGYVLLDFFA